jgi:hypothetical protein
MKRSTRRPPSMEELLDRLLAEPPVERRPPLFISPDDMARRWCPDPTRDTVVQATGQTKHHRFIRSGEDGTADGVVERTAIGWLGTTKAGPCALADDSMIAFCAIERAALMAGPLPPSPGWLPDGNGGWVTAKFQHDRVVNLMPFGTPECLAFLNGDFLDLSTAPWPEWLEELCPDLYHAIYVCDLTAAFPDLSTAIYYSGLYLRYIDFIEHNFPIRRDDLLIPLDDPTKVDPDARLALSTARMKLGVF